MRLLYVLWKHLTATHVVAFRLLLASAAIAIYSINQTTMLLAAGAFVLVELLDAIDGKIARIKGHPSPLGGLVDLLTDQAIEIMFWVLFVDRGLVPLWIPVVITVRNLCLNLLRIGELGRVDAMFGTQGVLRGRLSQLLVASWTSRAVMVMVKVGAFVALILLDIARTVPPEGLHVALPSLGFLEALAWGLIALMLANLAVRTCLYILEWPRLIGPLHLRVRDAESAATERSNQPRNCDRS